MRVIRVDIHKKLASASVEKGQKLNVSVVNYISPENKAKSEQSRLDNLVEIRLSGSILDESTIF